MPSSETIELRKIKGTVGNIDDSAENNPRSSVVSRIRGLLLRITSIPQLIHLYGALKPNKTLTFDSGEDKAISLFSDGSYLYAGLFTIPGKVIKIDLSTFTKVSTLTLDSGENYVKSLFSDGTYLYAGLETFPGKVIKIDLSTFTKVSTLTLDSGEDKAISLFSDGTYLYAGLYTSPGKVIKIDLSTFTKVSTLTLDSGENFAWSLFSDGSYLYIGLNTSPGKVIKIDLSTFTKVSTLTLDSGEDKAISLFSDGTYLYAGLYTMPGRVIKIDLSTFTKVSTLTLDSGENYAWSLFSDGTYLYAGLVTSPGKVIKIDLSTFTKVYTLTLNGGENIIYSMFSDGTYLYAGLYTSPGKIIRRYIIPTTNFIERKISLIHENVGTGDVEDGTDAQLTVVNGTGEVTIKTFDKATYNTGFIKAFKIDLDKSTSGFQTLAAADGTIIIRVYEKIDGTNYRLRTDDGESYTWTDGVSGDKVAEINDISFSKDCQIRAVLSAAPSGTISLPWLCEMNKNMRM